MAILVMCVAIIPYHIAHSLISNIRIGENFEEFAKDFGVEFEIFFSSNAIFNSFDYSSLARLSLLLLADRRPFSPPQRQSRNLLHRTRSVKNRRRRRDCDRSAVRLWCRELSLYKHELLHPRCDTKRCACDGKEAAADNGPDQREEEENRDRKAQQTETAEQHEKLDLGTDHIGDEQIHEF